MNKEKMLLYLVDDDLIYLKTLELEFLESGTFDVRTFSTGEICLQALDHKPDIIVLDYHLNGVDMNAMNGIDTLDQIKLTDATIPVIMLSSQDKIEVAVNCMHHHALDYVVKSETAFMRLQKIIENIRHTSKVERELSWYMDRM